MKRLTLLFSICFLAFSCSSPVLAAEQHKIWLTKAEAHKATEIRLAMLQKEWPEIIKRYVVARANICKRHSRKDMICPYELTNEPTGFSASIVCSGNAKLHLNYGNSHIVNVKVILGLCKSSGTSWSPEWR